MTLEEFRNLKVGDEIVFENNDVYKLVEFGNSREMIFAKLDDKRELIFRTTEFSSFVSICFGNGRPTFTPFISLNISLNIPEKEKIQNQIKLLQDKLKELEKNDVENIIKTLVPGDFIEVYYKEPNDSKPYIYEVQYLNNSKIGIYSYESEDAWPIVVNSISKIIVRKDIKEAHEKFLSLVRSIP